MTTLSITYASIKTQVLRLSEYIGLKAGAFDKLRAITDDTDQLQIWYNEGLNIVSNILDRIIAKPVTTDDTLGTASISLRISNTNDSAALLTDSVERVIVTHIIVKWLKLVAPQLMETYMLDHNMARDELTRLAYFREMPK